MELIYNRRLLLHEEDVSASTRSPVPLPLHSPKPATNFSSPPGLFAGSSFMFGMPLNLPPRSAFNPNVAYTILVLLTALFLLGFISMYIRRFAIDSPATISSRRRRHIHRSSPSSSNYYSASVSCGGLDLTTIQSLPVFAYNGDAKQQVDCAICLDEFLEAETVKMIPYCKHVFHQECIDTWLFSHVTCPICRCTKIYQQKRQGGVDINKVEENSDEGVSNHHGGSTAENGDE